MPRNFNGGSLVNAPELTKVGRLLSVYDEAIPDKICSVGANGLRVISDSVKFLSSAKKNWKNN
jgi:hypothetical protein